MTDDQLGASGARARRPVAFRQADISRAVKGAQAAGLSVASVQVDRDGRIVLTVTQSTPTQSAPDAALAQWMARNAG